MMNAVKHWSLVKISSIAMIPLTLWFFINIACLTHRGASFESFFAWLHQPVNGIVMALFVATSFYHSHLGGQEVIIDYIPDATQQKICLCLYTVFCFALGLLGAALPLYISFAL